MDVKTGRLALLVLAVAGLSGCSSTEPVARSSPAASTPTCRLPVVMRKFDPATATWSDSVTAFLTYPGGALTTVNATGVRYDARRDRWLPDGIPTPDGSAYVYADLDGAVHGVNVDTGVDQVIVAPAWRPLAFVGGQLYLVKVDTVTDRGVVVGFRDAGLAWVDATGGRPTMVTSRAARWWVSSLGGWMLDRADGLQQAPDRVLHLDLATGAIEPWLSSIPDVTLVGFDDRGDPFAVSQGDPIRVVRITGRGADDEIFDQAGTGGWPDFPSYSDGTRVWFSGLGTRDPTFEAPVWLYVPGSGLQVAIRVPGAQVSVAGPCK